MNSALQRARATLDARDLSPTEREPAMDEAEQELLARYVDAFERYDMAALDAHPPGRRGRCRRTTSG